MGEEELLQLYFLSQIVPGKTASQRLNLLQDLGFNPFGGQEQFVAQEFVPEPEPYLRNPIADMYGQNEGYRRVFAAINNNVDPVAAVDQAIKDKVLKAPSSFDDKMPNPYDIAAQYAQREVENEMELANWEQKTAADRAEFMGKQDRLRAEFEQKRPLSFADLQGQSQFEAMGAPTVDELMNMSEQQRAGWAADRAPVKGSVQDLARMYGERVPRTGPAPVAPLREPVLPKQDIFRNEKYANALRAELEGRLGRAQQRFVPTDRSEMALKNIALMKLLGS